MDMKKILNSPTDKFLIPVRNTFTKWIVSQINKPCVYAGNRVQLDYSVNISNRFRGGGGQGAHAPPPPLINFEQQNFFAISIKG